MTDFGYPELKRIAFNALTQRTGRGAGSEAIAAAVQRSYADLEGAAAPLIGKVGLEALTGRTLYLLNRNYQWLALTNEPSEWTGPLAQIIVGLKRQTPEVAREAAGAMFSTLAGLIATLIGEPLTTRLLQAAWPDVFPDVRTKEK